MKSIRKLTKQQLGYLEGWISVVINTLLFFAKLWVGLLAGSVAMVADAWHTLSDSLTSLIVIAGFWISRKPADHNHPFGHGRAEAIGAIIIGTLLGVVGVNFVIDSIQRLIHFQKMHTQSIAILLFSISAIIKEMLSQFSIWAGRKTNSSALIADGWHHRSDAVASGLIVIGALLSARLWWIDGVLGLLVSLLILYAAYDVIWKNASHLLGERTNPALEQKIRSAISEVSSMVSDVYHLHFHKYGDHLEMTCSICVSPEMQIIKAHHIANMIEEKLKRDLDIEATVHIEPEAV